MQCQQAVLLNSTVLPGNRALCPPLSSNPATAAVIFFHICQKNTHMLFSFELKEKPENHKLLKEFNTLSQKQETVNVLIKYAVLEEARSSVPRTDVLGAEFGVWSSRRHFRDRFNTIQAHQTSYNECKGMHWMSDGV